MLVCCNGLLNRPGLKPGVGSIPMSSACSNARRDYILEKCVGRKAKLSLHYSLSKYVAVAEME